METVLIIVSVVFPLFSLTIGYFGLKRVVRNDNDEKAKNEGIILTKIDYITKSVDEWKCEQRINERKIDEHSNRIALVEASAKSAHKRMDEHMQGVRT